MAAELWRECASWLIRCQVIPRDHRVTWKNAEVLDLVNALRDGVLLCHLLNKLESGCIDLKEINLRPQMSQFLCLKNIRTFLQTCESVFALKTSDLFEPYMLFDCTDFIQVLHTLSKLSNCPRVQRTGLEGFSSPNHLGPHDYYNDDIYRNLEDLANDCDDFGICSNTVYSSVLQVPDEDIYEDLCSFHQTRKNPHFLEVPLEKRDYCVKELIETEKNYNEVLTMMIRYFFVPLKNIIQADDRKIIFLSIKEMAELHSAFHADLLKACSGSGKLSQCFLDWKDRFIIYGDYCSNLPRAQELVDELCSKHELIKQSILRCQTEANDGKFKLRDLLSVPMQRVLKYHLLLKELIRNTPCVHEDYPGLEKGLECMLDLAQYVNEVKRDNETLQIIHDIQASITDLDMPTNLQLKDYGRLLKDGELKLRSHNDNNRLKNRYVFIFDKVILMCKSTRGEHYSYKEALVLADYKIEDIAMRGSGRDKWSFNWFLVHREKKVAYTMYAKTEEMKVKWIEAIEKAFDNVHPAECQETDHSFEMNTFEKARYCDCCDRLLRGVFYQGYLCSSCNLAVHKGCISCVRSCGAPNLPPRPGELRIFQNNATSLCSKRHPISYCIAKKSQTGTATGFVSFEAGDEIHILKKLSPVKWEGRVTRSGQEGWFYAQHVEEQPLLHSQPKRMSYEVPPVAAALHSPQNLLQEQVFHFQYVNLNLDEYPWYAGKMDKDTATVRLEKKELPDGTFLVRISERQNGIYVISIKHENKVKHMRVQSHCSLQGQNLFYLSESKYFKSIVELVKWYQEKTLADSFTGLDITLTRPFKNAYKGVAVPLSYAVANYDFTATAANMLTLKQGDVIAILCKQGGEKGWWKGQVNTKVGFFPATYVSEVL